MSENNGFIKKFRSSKAKELKRKHTNAFLILDTLAENAKRSNDQNCHPLLEIGEGIVTAEECGLSPQQFETGIKYLSTNDYAEVIHRGRKDKNSKLLNRICPESKTDSPRINLLNTSRINGTVLKLLDSDIYDINISYTPNHIPNQKRIHPESHPEQTRNIRNKEIEEEQYISREARTAAGPPEKKSNFLIEKEYFFPSESKKVVGYDFVKENFEKSSSNENVNLVTYENKAIKKDESVPQQNITCIISPTNSSENETKLNKLDKKQTKSKQKKKKELKPEIPKKAFRKNVLLTQDEHDKLLSEFGQTGLDWILNKLHFAKMSNGYEYQSDYGAIHNWVIGEYQKSISSKSQSQPSSSIEENKKFAQQVANSFISNYYKIEALNTKIEFTPHSGQSIPDVVNYSENGFRDQVENILRKRQFKEKRA